MGSCAFLMALSPDQNDELGMVDGDDSSISPQSKLTLTAVLEGLTVQLAYVTRFEKSRLPCTQQQDTLFTIKQ